MAQLEDMLDSTFILTKILTDFDEFISFADSIFGPLKVSGPHVSVELISLLIISFSLSTFFAKFFRLLENMSRLRENAAE